MTYPFQNGAGVSQCAALEAACDIFSSGIVAGPNAPMQTFLKRDLGITAREPLSLSMVPGGRLLRAPVLSATARWAAQATVLRPRVKRLPNLRQINLLPLAPGRARCILFLNTEEFAAEENIPNITRRERQILVRAVRGERREQVAFALGVSVSRVDMHLRNLREKFGLRTTNAVVARVVELGLCEEDALRTG